jgi:hypothetical protein
MTMLYRTYGDALKTILETNQGTDFVTYGYNARQKDAREYQGDNRTVEVVYEGGMYPKASGSRAGGQNHEMRFGVTLTVSEASKGDLATLDDPTAHTPLELQTAIAGLKFAEHAADESIDELADIVYQIVMSAANMDLGLEGQAVNPPASTWVSDFEKEKPTRLGDLVVIRGKFMFTCQGTEEVTGLNPVTGDAIEITLETWDKDLTEKDTVQQWKVKTTP